jgi:hypothetical protein
MIHSLSSDTHLYGTMKARQVARESTSKAWMDRWKAKMIFSSSCSVNHIRFILLLRLSSTILCRFIYPIDTDADDEVMVPVLCVENLRIIRCGDHRESSGRRQAGATDNRQTHISPFSAPP